ncbi:hypothetical protein LT40_15650 [Pseudomonas rhizosphaerae]|jgi:hypothetical protein|uniref:Uncharacterized protein n=1 Tax=Pseudomonas rhizosphaerae TaxID=216142 RepID=A0A089YWG1_9PSED|nr:hypothetical protein [Pseudomonas rhizosphaerae]AIS18742.1 hypothetical protein LT40_15650 [Pseudomonas rhizosphaerae]
MKKIFALTILVLPLAETSADTNTGIQIHTCESLYATPSNLPSDVNPDWGGICSDEHAEERGFTCSDHMMGRFNILPDFQNDPNWIAQAIFDHCVTQQDKTAP